MKEISNPILEDEFHRLQPKFDKDIDNIKREYGNRDIEGDGYRKKIGQRYIAELETKAAYIWKYSPNDFPNIFSQVYNKLKKEIMDDLLWIEDSNPIQLDKDYERICNRYKYESQIPRKKEATPIQINHTIISNSKDCSVTSSNEITNDTKEKIRENSRILEWLKTIPYVRGIFKFIELLLE